MSRFQKIVVALLAVLIVAVVVATVIFVRTQADAQEREDYLRCLEIRGFTPDDPPTDDAGLRELSEAAAECSS